jgi:hypothetical protein
MGMDNSGKFRALAKGFSSADQAGTPQTITMTPAARIICLNQRGEPMTAPFVSIMTTSGNAYLRSTWSWIEVVPDRSCPN